MLGSNKYKINGFIDLSNERLKALVFFYLPLIGNNSFSIYQYLIFNSPTMEFKEISELLNILNISIDTFEEAINKLNEYKLLTTYKKQDDDQYIFVLNNPKDMHEFINNDIFVRNFIMTTSGKHYQELLSNINVLNDKYDGYQNISRKLDLSILDNWKQEDESFLTNKVNDEYSFNTIFNINHFLKDMSAFLFPMQYRTKENLHEIALLADLYNVSYDKMRTYISKVIKTGEDKFDLNALKRLCMSSISEFKKIENDEYNVPSIIYLSNLQDGKEASPYDKQVIYNLAHDYKLNIPVINVLLKHSLKQCDNRLIEKYIYSIASDLHRNNIKTSSEALERLDRFSNNKKEDDIMPVYDTSNNPNLDENRLLEILNRRKNNDSN